MAALLETIASEHTHAYAISARLSTLTARFIRSIGQIGRAAGSDARGHIASAARQA